MRLNFIKMHGLENDFVLVDATKEAFSLTREVIQKIANRRTGIGFDQLLVIESSFDQRYDFGYRIFNADGTQVEQCGNGARCVAHYIFSEKLSKKTNITLCTLGGPIELSQEANGQIRVNMGVPQFDPPKIPFVTAQIKPWYELILDGHPIKFGAVSMGNPHAVIPVKDVSTAPVNEMGHRFQHLSVFPMQVNVGFMEIVTPRYIRLRVYERGVGETRSCGSGACAAVAVGRLTHALEETVQVGLPGGELTITWPSDGVPLQMIGPAQEVFRGQVIL